MYIIEQLIKLMRVAYVIVDMCDSRIDVYQIIFCPEQNKMARIGSTQTLDKLLRLIACIARKCVLLLGEYQ